MAEIPHDRVRNRWEHSSGAHVWMKVDECLVEGKAAKQANLHVRVPEEHQEKGIGKELLERAVADLEEEANTRLAAKDRFHNAYVTLTVARGEMAAAKATYEGGGVPGHGRRRRQPVAQKRARELLVNR
ncbi:MAG: hypothetical protein KAW41_02930 [Candidatus Diapherotrites archaeon]|nr:hypothetical protein [Candidatus Diapherotrites archaeon]